RFDGGPPARSFTSSSACGVCGKATLDQVEANIAPVPAGPARLVDRALVTSLPDRLRAAQRLFGATGGLHASGLFDLAGHPLAVREDVGRHNAVDKVVGHGLLGAHLPYRDRLLMVSGRVGFEIVQTAAA